MSDYSDGFDKGYEAGFDAGYEKMEVKLASLEKVLEAGKGIVQFFRAKNISISENCACHRCKMFQAISDHEKLYPSNGRMG